MSTFSERLKQLRAEKKVTQRDVAMFLGITDRAYQYYEYGSREPNIGVAEKLAGYFDVPTDYLIGRTNDSSSINFTPMSRNILSDNRLSLEAKGMYMQLQYFAADNKALISDEEKFLSENKISKENFDEIIRDLESFGYIKTVVEACGKNSEKIYVLL